jgi:hypothetical protein
MSNVRSDREIGVTMQTREQVKNWKVVASVATAAALGVSGLAIASPGDPADAPPPIEIQDTRNTAFTATTQPDFEVVPAPSFTMGDDSLDSPLASADTAQDSPESSPASPDAQDSPESSPASPHVQDSPDSSPATTTAPSSNDSPDDSPDDSVDSLDT